MSEAQKGAKKNLFEKEIRVLRDSKAFMENENLSAEELRKHLNEINDHYEELVDQSKLITKVSGAINLSSEGLFAQKNGLNLEFKGLTSNNDR